MAKTDAFDFINSITYGKNDLLAEGASEKDYVPYLTNKALSYYPDTILYANEMNLNHHLPPGMQYTYLLGSVRKKKRRSLWHKMDKGLVELIALVSHAMNISAVKARQAIPLLSEEQIEIIRSKSEKGGY